MDPLDGLTGNTADSSSVASSSGGRGGGSGSGGWTAPDAGRDEGATTGPADAAGPANDGGVATPDGAGPAQDAAGSGNDAAGSANDAAGSGNDAAGSANDAAGSGNDAAGATNDAGASDAAPPRSDAAEETSPPPPPPPITFVQLAVSTPPGTVSSVSAKLAQAQGAGDLLVVAVGWNDATSAISTVTDSAGDSFALAVGPTRLSPDLSQALYYAPNVAAAAAGANSVKVAFVASANVVDLRVAEYAGLATVSPFDGAAAGTGKNAGPASAGPVTTTASRSLLVAAGMTTDMYTTAGSGFTTRLVTTDGDVLEDDVAAAPGSWTAQASFGLSSEWVFQVAAFH